MPTVSSFSPSCRSCKKNGTIICSFEFSDPHHKILGTFMRKLTLYNLTKMFQNNTQLPFSILSRCSLSNLVHCSLPEHCIQHQGTTRLSTHEYYSQVCHSGFLRRRKGIIISLNSLHYLPFKPNCYIPVNLHSNSLNPPMPNT